MDVIRDNPAFVADMEKVMDVVYKLMNFALQMMNFVFKMMDFAFKVVHFVFTMRLRTRIRSSSSPLRI